MVKIISEADIDADMTEALQPGHSKPPAAADSKPPDPVDTAELSVVSEPVPVLLEPAELSKEIPEENGEFTVSDADQAEIENKIEEITRRNRLEVDPGELRLKPRKKEFVFPFFVNLLIIGIAALFIWLSFRLFTREETVIAREGTGFSSAEGHILRQLREDMEALLLEKEGEIAETRNRLIAIGSDESAFIAELEAKLQEQRQRLEAALERDMAAEEARLRAMGLSREEINRRLSRYREQRQNYYHTELEQYQRELAAEQRAGEERFARLREEYQARIAELNSERRQIQEEYRRGEEVIRSKAAGVPAPAASEELAQARAALNRLEEEKRMTALGIGTQSAEDREKIAALETALEELRRLLSGAETAAETARSEKSAAETEAAKAQAEARAARTAAENAKTEVRAAPADNSGTGLSMAEAIRLGQAQGIANMREILETTLRIRSAETRLQYLRNIKTRFAEDREVNAFIDVLVQYLAG